MTQHGFYSIVQKEPGTFHIRAREQQDLENLIRKVPLPDATIIETKDADYRFRLLVGQEAVQAILNFLSTTLDYDNFKSRIGRTPDQHHKPYHEVWEVLAGALGAYGRPGEWPKNRKEHPMQVSNEAYAEVSKALDRYREVVEKTELTDSAKQTYLLHAEHFVRWLVGELEPGAQKARTGLR